MATLTGTIKTSLSASLSNTLDLGSASTTSEKTKNYSIANGAGAGQASVVWSDQRTLATSANEELDLNGSLTDGLGNTISFTRIHTLLVVAATGNSDTISVGGSATNGWNSWVGAAGDLVKVRPGGTLLVAGGDATSYAVTAATADQLKITNDASADSTYDIVLIGSEA